MTTSDFLNLIAILLAIVSVAVANNKKVWLYKFGCCEKVIVVAAIVTIHYFIFFPWFESHGLNFDCLNIEGAPLPSTWGYIISLVFVIWMIWKIAYSKSFPKQNGEELLTYYLGLINSNMSLLIEYMQSYHFEKIQSHIQNLNDFYEEERQEKAEKEFPFEEDEGRETQGKYSLDVQVFSDVVLNRQFIIKSIDVAPDFFLNCVRSCIHPGVVGLKEAVATYFRRLIRERNAILVNELCETSNFRDTSSICYRKEDDSDIVSIIFDNLEFTYTQEVFMAFGEEALRNSELGDRIFSTESNEWKNAEYHSTPAYLFLRFADIFFREIVNDIKDSNIGQERFLYLYYFRMICQNLIKGHAHHFEASYARRYVADVVENISDWIDVLRKLGITCYLHNLLNIISFIAEDLEENGLHKDGINVLDRFIHCFFGVEEKERMIKMGETGSPKKQPVTDVYWEKINTFIDKNNTCRTLMKETWERFDKIPYQNSIYISELDTKLK